ncbi:MAG: YraN family protein [Mycobacteriales bacterium]
MRESQQLGIHGEDVAAQHLVERGFVLLDRNWRCREGELDIVALDLDGACVFCEVKTRSTAAYGEPSEAVSAVKARRIRLLALRWLDAHPEHRGGPLRFDVVSIVRRRGWAPELVHLRGAF